MEVPVAGVYIHFLLAASSAKMLINFSSVGSSLRLLNRFNRLSFFNL